MKRPKIRLYISLFNIQDDNRKNEVLFCLHQNIQNKFIDEIIILNEGFNHGVLTNSKVQNVKFGSRPMFSDFYDYFEENMLNIIANNDIRVFFLY